MRLALMLALSAALAACGGGSDDAGPERRNAAGEVLGGDVTDAMLPLDTVRSTSPADPRRAAPGDGAAVTSEGPGAETAVADQTEAGTEAEPGDDAAVDAPVGPAPTED